MNLKTLAMIIGISTAAPGCGHIIYVDAGPDGSIDATVDQASPDMQAPDMPSPDMPVPDMPLPDQQIPDQFVPDACIKNLNFRNNQGIRYQMPDLNGVPGGDITDSKGQKVHYMEAGATQFPIKQGDYIVLSHTSSTSKVTRILQYKKLDPANNLVELTDIGTFGSINAQANNGSGRHMVGGSGDINVGGYSFGFKIGPKGALQVDQNDDNVQKAGQVPVHADNDAGINSIFNYMKCK